MALVNMTVAICTRNRADQLRETLRGLARLRVPSGCQCEFLIVDNGSTDDTRLVVDEQLGHLGNLQYVAEPIAGLTYARNAAMVNATGDVIIFIDDDAVPEEELLEAYATAYKAVDDRIACIGGKIKLVLPDPPHPVWFTEHLHRRLSAFDLGCCALHECSEDEFPFGANISFRRGALVALGGFRLELHRYANSRGDESEVCQRLCRAGYGIMYQPDAVVFHHIPPGRLTSHAFRRLAWNSGRAHVIMQNGGEVAVSQPWQLTEHVCKLGNVLSATARALIRSQERSRPLLFRQWLSAVSELSSVLYCIRYLRLRRARRPQSVRDTRLD